jgi:hypothetical protein
MNSDWFISAPSLPDRLPRALKKGLQLQLLFALKSITVYNHYQSTRNQQNKGGSPMNIPENILNTLTDEQKKKVEAAQSPEEPCRSRRNGS